MRKRAIFLFLLAILLPGSPQLLAGNRILGKIGIRATFLGWLGVALLGITFLIKRGWALTLVTTPWLGQIVTVVLYVYGIGFAILALDAFRLAQLGRLFAGARNVLIAFFLATAVGGVWAFAFVGNTVHTADGMVSEIFNQKGFSAPSEGRYNILLIGSDAGKQLNGLARVGIRPDSISVLSFNADTGAMLNIGIPRNLQHAPIPAGSPLRKYYGNSWDDLINTAYDVVTSSHPEIYADAAAHGTTAGVEVTRDLVEGVTGLKINSYVMVNMAAFADLVNQLGGLTVDVKVPIPIGGQKDDASDAYSWIKPGIRHLDGYHALWYARSRHGSTDYARMARQREIEQLILKKLTPANALSKFEKLAVVAKELINTDIPDGMVGTYADMALSSKAKKVHNLELVPANGFEPDVPDFAKIHAAVAAAIKASR
jgi:LCP family protein required for cell wall assembly